ncbi:MAG: FMN-binding protein, partial [Candidatus Aquiluna sp.]|nr:FMN-binding protein [Aquiluna sp.]
MRKSTLMVTSLFAASALTVAWNTGQLTANNEILLLPAESTSNPAPTEVAGTDPNATSTATAEPTAPVTAPATSSPEPGQTAAPAPSQTAAPAPTTPAAPVTATANSDPITYKYGTVQISMTTVDGAITEIKMLQGDATNGRDTAYATLINATIQNQGTNYGNISGATFTVDAFKKAVDSALL